MRPLLHLVSLLLALPVMALALAFVILGRVIAAGSWLGMFDQVLTTAVWLVPWGILAIVASLVAVAMGGVFVATRRMAGACVAALAVGSTLVVLVITIGHGNFTPDQVPFLVPGAVAACIGAWFALAEGPPDGTPRPASPGDGAR